MIMGTNFYWHDPMAIAEQSGWSWEPDLNYDDVRIHIGNRSAAGKYCWDCDETLYEGGRERIHYGGYDWLDACPKCGKPAESGQGLTRGPAAVELGFAQPETERPTGVSGTSSFSWAQDPERVGAICTQRLDDVLIEDEYGRTLTGHEFLTMLRANCAIQFTDLVGRVFS